MIDLTTRSIFPLINLVYALGVYLEINAAFSYDLFGIRLAYNLWSNSNFQIIKNTIIVQIIHLPISILVKEKAKAINRAKGIIRSTKSLYASFYTIKTPIPITVCVEFVGQSISIEVLVRFNDVHYPVIIAV